MLLFNVLVVGYFIGCLWCVDAAWSRTRQAESTTVSLLEELKSARQELTKANKALDGAKS